MFDNQLLKPTITIFDSSTYLFHTISYENVAATLKNNISGDLDRFVIDIVSDIRDLIKSFQDIVLIVCAI